MTDEHEPTASETTEPETPQTIESETDTGKDWQAEAQKWKSLARKHETAAKENSAAAKRLRELEDQNKTELQRLQDRAETAEKQAQELEPRIWRAEIAAEKGLTSKQAARLQGSTRDEMEADADELLETFGAAKKPADFRQGARGGNSSKTRQLTRNDLTSMTPEQITKAKENGQLDNLLKGIE